MMKKLLLFLVLIWVSTLTKAQGTHVFEGSEFMNFGTIHLATSSNQTWTTNRSATPGYFSAYYPGTVYTGASDANNINGYVKKYGNESFTFPVGNGTDLRSLSMSAPASSTDAYATAWILGNPKTTPDPTNADALHDTAAVAGTIKRVMGIGQWDWQAISGSGAGLSITASMPNLSSFAPAGHLRLVGWDAATSKWIALGTIAPSGSTENTSIQGTMAAGIDAISIGSIANGFPDFAPLGEIDSTSFSTVGVVRDFNVNITEVKGNLSSGQLIVRIAKPSAFTITYSATSTNANVNGGTAVNNSNWTFTENTAFITATLKVGQTINGNALSTLGFSVSRKPGIPSNTSQGISIIISTGTGSDSNNLNNSSTISVTAL